MSRCLFVHILITNLYRDKTNSPSVPTLLPMMPKQWGNEATEEVHIKLYTAVKFSVQENLDDFE